MTTERAETVIEEVARVEHEVTVTIEGKPEDAQVTVYGITQSLWDRYRNTMVSGSFTIHSDGSNVCRWTWETKAPDATGQEEKESE